MPKTPSSGVRVARGATYLFVQGVASTLISVVYLLFLVRIPQTRLPPPPNSDACMHLGQSTVTYKLMTYGKETKLGSPPSVTLTHFDLTYFSKREAIQGQVYALVCIYEVKYY